ncbi:MAG: right-handed parallel beta-helix repeat-containing protein [Rhodothermales bacterium]|nr:right-handed parallel beta-helix repeat-containing protein [Rhodothermales bacterium]
MTIQLALISVVTAAAFGGGEPQTLLVPSEYATIQSAIEAASAGDEVVVAPGLYYEAVDFLGKAITVRSSDGPLVTTIDPFKEDPPRCDQREPCVQFTTSEGRDSVLRGFTLTDGLGFFKGGGCSFEGGGVYILQASPTIEDCIFFENSHQAGGLAFSIGSPRIDGCYFEANESAVRGEGIGAHAEFYDCVFRAHGDTVFISSSATVTLERCRIFSSSVAGLRGGAHATAVVIDSVFGENFKGVEIAPALELTVSGTLFCDNEIADIEGDYVDAGGNQFLKTCPPLEDIDLDGIVGFTDLLSVLTSWGICVGCPADIDFSGEVNFLDLLSVLAAWG